MAPEDDSIGVACRLVADALARPAAEVPPDGSIYSIPAWDSLGHVRVLLAIEAKIGRPLPSETIATLASVEDVAAILASTTPAG